ncbi:GD12879 [Drosophila simulans]|uniref:U5 small nuclear ribonucleoprotein TSSC4 n=1 Tax=Drosophila simulans TaxID=7240 RepID=B4QNR9_DROSI|nr:GD12879 [Drosophila simulans]
MQEFSAKRDALFACLDDASKELRGTALDQSKAKAFSINALDRGNKSGNGSGQVMNYRQGRSIDTGLDAEDGRLRRMRGKESIFKKPELPIGRCLKPRKTPDYQVNPHKWKKYSLSDVDISEQSNSAAALSFLRQMDAQREAEGVDSESHPADGKIEFKRTSKLSRKLKSLKQQEVEDVELDKPQLRGSKLVMPEYAPI